MAQSLQELQKMLPGGRVQTGARFVQDEHLGSSHQRAANQDALLFALREMGPRAGGQVSAFHLLEHVPDVHAVLRNCFEVLKPGGWLVCSVPLIDSMQARVFRSRWAAATEAPRHLSIPSSGGIAQLCRNVGFDSPDMRPDSILMCLGVAVLSVLPGAATAYVYGGSGLYALSRSVLALLVGTLALPWCLLDNYVLRRPPIGLVVAHKPEAAS